MIIKENLKRAILRSELAYEHYKSDKLYFQALRIFSANQEVYKNLVEYSQTCNEEELQDVFNYIFHLEDWFNQFENEMLHVELNEVFVFERLEKGIAYPNEFIKKLK
ncbi:MAG: hypothetical protein WDA08_02640 [Weeksellaceae bacterium]